MFVKFTLIICKVMQLNSMLPVLCNEPHTFTYLGFFNIHMTSILSFMV